MNIFDYIKKIKIFSMFFFIKVLLSLELVNLKLKYKNLTVFDNSNTSILSYTFLKDYLNLKTNYNKTFYNGSNDFAKLFFYRIIKDDDRYTENRIYMFESSNVLEMCDYNIKINDNFSIVEINPNLKIECENDNHQKIKVQNIFNFSKFIWKNYLQSKINNNKSLILNIIDTILEEPRISLVSMFKNCPLLYFNKTLEKIYDIFDILKNIINSNNIITFNTIYESLKNFSENYDENIVMQRYHSLKGEQITNASKNFCLSCLLTDIENILGYYTNNKYIYKVYNFIEFNNTIISNFFIGFEIEFNINNVKLDENGNLSIYVFDQNGNKENDFLLYSTKDKIFIFIERIFCLNKSLMKIKVIIESKNKMFESNLIDIKSLIIE